MALAGSDIFAAAKNAGVATRSGGTRTGTLNRKALRDLGLSEVRRQLSQMMNRRVNFMVYRSVDEAMSRGPSVKIPR